MNEQRSGYYAFLGVASCVIIFVMVMFGFMIGREKAADDCDDFEQFKHGSRMYECVRQPNDT